MPSVMPRVYESDFWIIELLQGRLVWLTRLARPFASEEEVNAACEPVQRALDEIGRSTASIVIDSRAARGSNDPTYERWFARHRTTLPQGFLRAAILMRTPVGALHSERLRREDGNQSLGVFHDVQAVSAFLGVDLPPDRAEPISR